MIICEDRQRIIDSNENLLILGGPGSGKTTIALIKAVREVEKLKPRQKILFLSFARSTVSRIEERSKELLNTDARKSIEINTYHGFNWNIIKNHGYLLNSIKKIKLLSPADIAVKFSILPVDLRKDKIRELFYSEGLIGFDVFAELAVEILKRNPKLRKIVSASYPLIILDEFQDTDSHEWELIKLLGINSKLIALADADQRIYEFRGADPARLGEFITQFNPLQVDFGIQNNRSSGTDIAIYGNDLLTGANKNKEYNDVKLILYSYMQPDALYHLKLQTIQAIRRLKENPNWSIGLLVPTKSMMLMCSNYLSSSLNRLPPIKHDVAIDNEGPALASVVYSEILGESDSYEKLKKDLLLNLINHIKGRRGAKLIPGGDLALTKSLEKYITKGTITGKNNLLLIREIELIATGRMELTLTGNPGKDWLSVNELFDNVLSKPLTQIRDDVKFVRLLHKGSALREALSLMWRQKRSYKGATLEFQAALSQAYFSSDNKKMVGINVMTIHKSKGKEFDEVIICEGRRRDRIVRFNSTDRDKSQSRLTLRVAVTRAMKKTTILTPDTDRCELL